MPITAFVTGGAGFLGQRVVAGLLERGLRVRCLVRRADAAAEMLSRCSVMERERLEFVIGDLLQPETYADRLDDVDVVYHLAAALSGSCAAMFLNTVAPTRLLARASATAEVPRFVLVSSLGVYGTGQLRRAAELNESAPIDPHPEQRDPYTFSKIRQEAVAREAEQEWGLPLVVVRPGVIYGEGRSPLSSRVGLSLGPLFLRLSGRLALPYTYVENCADAIILAGLTAGVEGQTFNIVDDDPPTAGRILQLLRRQAKIGRVLSIPSLCLQPLAALYAKYSTWTEGQLPPVLTPYKCDAIWKPLRYSNAHARKNLNWRPRIPTEQALRRTISL